MADTLGAAQVAAGHGERACPLEPRPRFSLGALNGRRLSIPCERRQMESAQSLKRRDMRDKDPVRSANDQRLNRLVRLNDQIADLQRRPKDDRLAARLIETLRREESRLRLSLHTGNREQPTH
jgi:hypothetical protein